MKISKKLGIWIILVQFQLMFAGFIYAQGQPALKLVCSLSKDDANYLIDQPIYLEVLVSNISNDEIPILPLKSGSSWDHFRIIILDQNGKRVANHEGKTFMALNSDWTGFFLKPGERWLLVKDLLGVFGKWGDPAHQLSLYLPSGSYTVKAEYDTNPYAFIGKNRMNEDKKTITSNVIHFKVVEPSSLKEQEEYNKFIETLETYNFSFKNAKKQISVLTDFISGYPNSVYLPQACAYLYYAYSINPGYRSERNKLIKEIFFDLAKSGLTFEILQNERITKIREIAKLTVSPEKIAEMLKLKTNTKASFYAECLIEMQRIANREVRRAAVKVSPVSLRLSTKK